MKQSFYLDLSSFEHAESSRIGHSPEVKTVIVVDKVILDTNVQVNKARDIYPLI